MEERGRQREVSRGGFVAHAVPVLTSAFLVAPGPIIEPHSSLVSEVRAGQCNLIVPGLFYQHRGHRAPKAGKSTAGPQAGL